MHCVDLPGIGGARLIKCGEWIRSMWPDIVLHGVYGPVLPKDQAYYCIFPATHNPTRICFSDPEHAMLFKLAWGGQ